MNKIIAFIISTILFLGCIGKHKSEAQKATVNSATDQNNRVEADTVKLDKYRSKINWAATEMRGTMKRNGKINFQEGFFLIKKNEIVGGYFIVDMETMDVTDVPKHETTARRNLITHLKSDDFFSVSTYPFSTLDITSVEKVTNDSLKINSNLKIRDITKNIQFYSIQKENTFKTVFTINRFDWNIVYEGSWVNRTLVDKDLKLDIEIQME